MGIGLQAPAGRFQAVPTPAGRADPQLDGRRGAATLCIADFRASLGHRVRGARFGRALQRRVERLRVGDGSLGLVVGRRLIEERVVVV